MAIPKQHTDRWKGKQARNSAASEALKRKWQDPEFRAKHEAMLRDYRERRGQAGMNRYGVPHGMRKWQTEPLWAEARESARKTMEQLEASGKLDETDAYAKEALEQAIVIMRAPGDKRTALAAAKLVLDFCRAKPATKAEVTINKAEEWLAAVAADSAHEPEATEDEEEAS